MMKQISLALLATLLVTLLVAVPVFAVPPDVGEVIEEAYVDPDVVDCTVFGYDFKIQDYLVISTQTTIFYDQDGTPVMRMKGRGTDNLFNPNNPDYKIPASFSWNFRGDPETFDGIMTGAFWRVVLPGYGPVFFHVGRAEFNLEDWYVPLHGHHELDEKLCEVLDFHGAEQISAEYVSLDQLFFLPSLSR